MPNTGCCTSIESIKPGVDAKLLSYCRRFQGSSRQSACALARETAVSRWCSPSNGTKKWFH